MDACCDRCRRLLEPGALRFQVQVRISGDTGDEIPAREVAACTEESLAAVLAQASQLSEQELMEDVVEELRYVLCPACRRHLRGDPAGARTMPGPPGRSAQ